MQEAEVMTQNEAVTLAALYRRERDDLADRLLVASAWRWLQGDDEKEAAAKFMQRPGIQNGLKKVEEMEAGQGSIEG